MSVPFTCRVYVPFCVSFRGVCVGSGSECTAPRASHTKTLLPTPLRDVSASKLNDSTTALSSWFELIRKCHQSRCELVNSRTGIGRGCARTLLMWVASEDWASWSWDWRVDLGDQGSWDSVEYDPCAQRVPIITTPPMELDKDQREWMDMPGEEDLGYTGRYWRTADALNPSSYPKSLRDLPLRRVLP